MKEYSIMPKHDKELAGGGGVETDVLGANTGAFLPAGETKTGRTGVSTPVTPVAHVAGTATAKRPPVTATVTAPVTAMGEMRADAENDRLRQESAQAQERDLFNKEYGITGDITDEARIAREDSIYMRDVTAQDQGFSSFDDQQKYWADYDAGRLRQEPIKTEGPPPVANVPVAEAQPPGTRPDEKGVSGVATKASPFPTQHPMVEIDGRPSNVLLATVTQFVDNRDGELVEVGRDHPGAAERHYVIPTLIGGARYSVAESEAIAREYGMGNFPNFATIEEADSWARENHDKIKPPSGVLPPIPQAPGTPPPADTKEAEKRPAITPITYGNIHPMPNEGTGEYLSRVGGMLFDNTLISLRRMFAAGAAPVLGAAQAAADSLAESSIEPHKYMGPRPLTQKSGGKDVPLGDREFVPYVRGGFSSILYRKPSESKADWVLRGAQALKDIMLLSPQYMAQAARELVGRIDPSTPGQPPTVSQIIESTMGQLLSIWLAGVASGWGFVFGTHTLNGIHEAQVDLLTSIEQGNNPPKAKQRIHSALRGAISGLEVVPVAAAFRFLGPLTKIDGFVQVFSRRLTSKLTGIKAPRTIDVMRRPIQGKDLTVRAVGAVAAETIQEVLSQWSEEKLNALLIDVDPTGEFWERYREAFIGGGAGGAINVLVALLLRKGSAGTSAIRVYEDEQSTGPPPAIGRKGLRQIVEESVGPEGEPVSETQVPEDPGIGHRAWLIEPVSLTQTGPNSIYFFGDRQRAQDFAATPEAWPESLRKGVEKGLMGNPVVKSFLGSAEGMFLTDTPVWSVAFERTRRPANLQDTPRIAQEAGAEHRVRRKRKGKRRFNNLFRSRRDSTSKQRKQAGAVEESGAVQGKGEAEVASEYGKGVAEAQQRVVDPAAAHLRDIGAVRKDGQFYTFDSQEKAEAFVENRDRWPADYRKGVEQGLIKPPKATSTLGSDTYSVHLDISARVEKGAEAEAEPEGSFNDRVDRIIRAGDKARRDLNMPSDGSVQLSSFPNINPNDVVQAKNLAIVGASYIAKGIKGSGPWKKAMMKLLGTKSKPYLQKIHNEAKEYYKHYAGTDPVDELKKEKTKQTPTAPPLKTPASPLKTPASPSVVKEPASARKYPVVDIKVDDLQIDVARFQPKGEADPTTGVVKQLKGTYNPLAGGNLLVWEDSKGVQWLMHGHHRLDLAKREGEATVPVQVIREVDGNTAADARAMAADINILNETGEVKDFAEYFRTGNYTEKSASDAGLLAREKGRAAFTIGAYSEDPLYALYRRGGDDGISQGKAEAIAGAAHDGDKGYNEALQAAGIKIAQDRISPDELRARVEIIKRRVPEAGKGENQMTLFAEPDQSVLDQEKRVAKAVKDRIDGLVKSVSILGHAASKPKSLVLTSEQAKEFGIKDKDRTNSDVIKAKLVAVKLDLYGWRNQLLTSRRIEIAEKDAEVETTASGRQLGLVPATDGGIIGKQPELFRSAQGPVVVRELSDLGKTLKLTQSDYTAATPFIPVDIPAGSEQEASFVMGVRQARDGLEKVNTAGLKPKGIALTKEGFAAYYNQNRNDPLAPKADDSATPAFQEYLSPGKPDCDVSGPPGAARAKGTEETQSGRIREKVAVHGKRTKPGKGKGAARTALGGLLDDKIITPEQHDGMVDVSPGIGKKTIVAHLKEIWDSIVMNTQRGALIHLDRKKWGRARAILRRIPLRLDNAHRNAAEALGRITDGLSKQEFDVFQRYVAFNDFDNTKVTLPFGLTADQAKLGRAKLQESVDQSPALQTALKIRGEVWTALREDYTQAMASINHRHADLFQNKEYFRHQVMEYAGMQAAAKGGRVEVPAKRSYMKKRKGSELPINMNYLQVEFSVISQMLADAETARILREITTEYDIYGKLNSKARRNNLVAAYGGKGVYDRVIALRGKMRDLRETEIDSDIRKQMREISGELEKIDVLREFRIGMVRAKAVIAKMANGGGLPKIPKRFASAIRDLVYQFPTKQSEASGPLAAVEFSEDSEQFHVDQTESQQFFEFMTWLSNQEGESQGPARSFWKHLGAQKAKVQELAGEKFQTYADVLRDSPEGETHEKYVTRPGQMIHIAHTLREGAAQALLNAQLLGEGIRAKDATDPAYSGRDQGPGNKAAEATVITAKDLRRAAVIGSEYRPIVIPSEIAAQLDEFARKPLDKKFKRIWQGAHGAWKTNILLGPTSIAKYQIRNATEVEKVLAFNPRGASPRLLIESIRDLYKLFHADPGASANVRDWQQRGGRAGLLRQQELGSVMRPDQMKRFKRLADNSEKSLIGKVGSGAKAIWSGYWDGAGILTDYRESILRYANYLSYLRQMQADPNGLPKNYGGSLKAEILAIKDIRDRAYKLSNDLLGAYDDVSGFGQWFRKNMFSFWSFPETNSRTYIQGIRNIAKDDTISRKMGMALIGKSLGVSVAMKVGVKFPLRVLGLGRIGLTLWGAHAILQAWNHLVYGEEEDALPRSIKGRPHVVMGRDKNGNVIYFSRIGTSSEFMEWLGLEQLPQDLDDIFHSRRTLKEVVLESVRAPLNKLIQGLHPFFKLPAELAFEKSLYPDFKNPREIRHFATWAAKAVGLERELAAMLGKRVPSRPYWKDRGWDLIRYKVNEKETAYFESKSMVRREMKRLGKTVAAGTSERSRALYDFRKAIFYGDKDAAGWALQTYIRSIHASRPSVGSEDVLKSIKRSLESMHPLKGLTKEEQVQFLQGLTTEDQKDTILEGIRFYRLNLAPDRVISEAPVKAAA